MADAKVKKQWHSRICKDSGETHDVKYGPACKLPLLEQLFLPSLDCTLGHLKQTWLLDLGYHNHQFHGLTQHGLI